MKVAINCFNLFLHTLSLLCVIGKRHLNDSIVGVRSKIKMEGNLKFPSITEYFLFIGVEPIVEVEAISEKIIY